jgi:hypothetical protein
VEGSGAATGAAASDDVREVAKTSDEPSAESPAVPETHNALKNQGVEGNQEPSKTVGAERAGFEPAVGFYPHAALAKRCFRPLSHLSKRAARTATPRF